MKIFCIGRNYSEHAHELSNVVPDRPIVFIKPPTAYLKNGRPFPYPSFSSDVQHETEIVLKMDKHGKDVPESACSDFYSEITLGIDFTARDVQRDLKKKNLPWELAKGFDCSALVGRFIPKPANMYDLNFRLLKNEQLAQRGSTKDVLFSFEKLISFISIYFTIEPGDLIYTGTPVGVDKVQQGDVLEGFIQDQKLLATSVI